MANQLEVLLVAKDAGMTAAFNAASKSAQAMGNEIDRAATKVEAAGKKASKFGDAAKSIDAGGRNMKIGLGAAAQAADLLGLNIGGIIAPAMSAADAVGDVVGSIASLNPVVAGIGIAIVAAAAAAKLWSDEMERQKNEIAATIQYTDSYLASIRAIANESSGMAQRFQELTNVMALQKTQMGALNDATIEFYRTLGPLGGATGMAIASMQTLAEKETALKTQMDAMVWSMTSGYDAVERIREAHYSAANAADTQAAAEYNLARAMAEVKASAVDAYYEGMVKIQGATNTAFYNTVQLNHATVGSGNAIDAGATKWDAYNKLIGQRFPVSVGAAKSKYEEWKASLNDKGAYDKAKAAAEQMIAKLRSMVETATNIPSFEEHLKRIANGGKDAYENLFRFDALATGTDVSAYGADFEALAKQVQGLGYSWESAAAGIRNFSIFAQHPELITSGLIDMGAVVEDVKNQLLAMAGRANVVKEAMKQVWASLDPKQKAALAEQGIDDASEAVSALIDPAGQAKTQVAGLGSALGSIPRTVTSTINVIKDAAVLAIDEFREVLDQFIADYGSINISINAEANTSAGGTTTSTSSGIPGKATGGYVRNGVYRLGEAGYEYVLPHNMVKWLEGALGGKISSPEQIGWLVGALQSGKQETLNQMALFASRNTNHAVAIPKDADKWVSKTYEKYQAANGFNALPASVQASMGGGGGGAGAGGSGGGGMDDRAIGLLNSIDQSLKTLVRLGGGAVGSTTQQSRQVRTLEAHGQFA